MSLRLSLQQVGVHTCVQGQMSPGWVQLQAQRESPGADSLVGIHPVSFIQLVMPVMDDKLQPLAPAEAYDPGKC